MEPVLLEVLDDPVAELCVVLVVEDGEVLEQHCNDDVEEDESDEDVVGEEPDDGRHHIATVIIQLGAVGLTNLGGRERRTRRKRTSRKRMS